MRDRVACSSRSIAWAASFASVVRRWKRGRLRDGGRLDPREFLLERQEPSLRLGRQRLPHRPLLRLGGGGLLCGTLRLQGFFGTARRAAAAAAASDVDRKATRSVRSRSSSTRNWAVGSGGGRGGWNGPGLKARSPKVRWNQTASCRATLRPVNAVA